VTDSETTGAETTGADTTGFDMTDADTAAPGSTGADRELTARVTAAYTALADRWDTSGASWNQPVAARLVALARLAPGMRVLDAGCGAGAASIPAAAVVGPRGQVTGIDLAETMLARARRHAQAADLRQVTFQRADAVAPPFKPGSFDAVLASLVVYLLPGPAAALARWRALLRPGGRLAFSWVLAEDPAFEPAFAAVDAYLPEGRPGWGTSWRRWRSVAEAEAMLGTGYDAITTTVEPVTTRYDSPGHWWESSWTQAPRLAWQHIPPADRDAARDDAFRILEVIRAPDGTLARVRTTCYTTARAAPLAGAREPGLARW
jgi:ubiquinone/menaquinone biosynthesis C-methylase UbiE